jgi:hypothetical protein
VKEIFLTIGCVQSTLPTVDELLVVIMFTTPFGNPACSTSCAWSEMSN